MPRLRKLALVAHDSKKQALVLWARENLRTLKKLELLATGATGARLAKEVGLAITCLKSGPMGGDQQVGSRIAEGDIDLIVFLWDPLVPHAHEADLHALLRVAVVYDIPIACNLASANLMIGAFGDSMD